MTRSAPLLRPLPALALALAGLVIAGCAKRGGGFQMPPVPVEVAEVERGMVRDRFQALGSIEAAEIVQVVNEINAVVRELPFREGMTVTRGQLLARLDDSEIRAEADRAEALRDQARVNQARIKQLFDQRAASSQELDDASAALKVAEANDALAKARLAKTRIIAPFDGLVGRRLVSPGSFLRVGELITEVAEVNVMKVTFAAPERYLARLHRGAGVDVTTAAYPGEVFSGTVSVVDPIIDPQTRTVELVASVANRGRRLRPGMSANVSATLAERADALTLPDEAIFAQGDQNFVFVVKPDSTVVRQAIVIGTRDSSRAEIATGLKAGDRVVRAGYQKLFDGARVMPIAAGAAGPAGGKPGAAATKAESGSGR